MQHVLQRRVQPRARKGFTIIEIVIVIGLIGVIGWFVIRQVARVGQARPRFITETVLRDVHTDIQRFQLDTFKYPVKLADLMNRPAEVKRWKGPYMNEMPEDGWGNPLKYEVPGKGGKPYNLYSYGPNGPGAPQEEWISDI